MNERAPFLLLYVSYFTSQKHHQSCWFIKICRCSFVFKTIIVFVWREHYIIKSSHDINVHFHEICSLTGNPNYPPLLSSQSSYHECNVDYNYFVLPISVLFHKWWFNFKDFIIRFFNVYHFFRFWSVQLKASINKTFL
jgi:hypothetical protein